MALTKFQIIEREIETLKSKISDLERQKSELRKFKVVKCSGSIPHGKGCGKKFKIGGLIWVDEFYYDNEPYAEGHRHSRSYFVCPKCGILNDAKMYDDVWHTKSVMFKIYKGDSLYSFRENILILKEYVKKNYDLELKIASWWLRDAGLINGVS